MKRLELTVPTSLLDDLEILSDRFFRHNRSVQVLQSFSVRPQTNALIVRVHRKGPFKDEATVRREARAIARRYRVALLASEKVLPALSRLLDDVEAPYRVRAMKSASLEAWQPLASLTQRQRDLLELAYHLGYYASPAKASLRQIAGLVGITRAAVSKHLRAAERKIFAAALGANR